MVYDFLADLEDFLKIHDMHVVLGILSTYFSSPFLISLQASSPGKKGAGWEMEEELATTSLELILNSSSVVPRRLGCQFSDNQNEAETSANINTNWKTRSKGNALITNAISANQHFASTFSMQIFKFHRDVIASSPSFCQSAP